MTLKGVKDEKWLEDYLEHIGYEITGLIGAYVRLAQLEGPGFRSHHPLGDLWERNGSLDLLALHFRGLHEFFCDGAEKRYVRAADYPGNFKGTRNNLLLQKANLQVSHLSLDRHAFAQDLAKKQWRPFEVVTWLVGNLEGWKGVLPQGLLDRLNSELSPVNNFLAVCSDQIKKDLDSK